MSCASPELVVSCMFIIFCYLHNWYSRPTTFSVQFSALVNAQLSGNDTLTKYLEGRISVRVLGEFQPALCMHIEQIAIFCGII